MTKKITSCTIHFVALICTHWKGGGAWFTFHWSWARKWAQTKSLRIFVCVVCSNTPRSWKSNRVGCYQGWILKWGHLLMKCMKCGFGLSTCESLWVLRCWCAVLMFSLCDLWQNAGALVIFTCSDSDPETNSRKCIHWQPLCASLVLVQKPACVFSSLVTIQTGNLTIGQQYVSHFACMHL